MSVRMATVGHRLDGCQFKKYMDMLVSKIHPKYKSFLGTNKIAIAFSGGPDSLALLHLAKEHYGADKIVALFVNHNLQSKNVTEDMALVKKTLDTLGVEGKCYEMDWAPGEPDALNDGQFQEKLREKRYKLMFKGCKEFGVKLLLTGHNVDDDISTLFYRMAHGSGVDGLAAMKPICNFPFMDTFGAAETFIGHPLLSVRKCDLLKYCKEKKLEWNVDKSNEDLSFRRNSVTDAIGRLTKEKIVSEQELVDLLTFFKKCRKHLQESVEEAFKKSVHVSTNNGDAILVLNDPVWLSQNAIGTRILSILSQYAGVKMFPPRTKRLLSMLADLQKSYKEHDERMKMYIKKVSARYRRKITLFPIDKTKRLNCNQMTVGTSTFYSMGRSDAMNRIDYHNRFDGAKLEHGPTLLVQREPPNRINHQQTRLLPTENVKFTQNVPFLWDNRFFIRLVGGGDSLVGGDSAQEWPLFDISYTTVADVREFQRLCGHKGFTFLSPLRSYLSYTPGSHIFQIPVIREVGSDYMAFPTLGIDYPRNKWRWTTAFAGLSVISNKIHCLA